MYNEPFTILGIPASASIEEIHAAYRNRARKHHPDLGGDRQKFQELSEAYAELIRVKEAESTVSFSAPQKPAEPRSSPNPDGPPTRPLQPVDSKKKKKKTSPQSSIPDRAKAAKHLLTGKLPLQDQTTYFILVNALDIFLTYLHLRNGNYEANPIAAFFIRNWDVGGMVVYKMTIVASVCTIAQIVALSSLRKASSLLNFGTLFITCVVIYSVWLLAR